MYRNDTDEGWTIDASAPTDRVLAVKGGAAAYNVDGGNTAGSWTITGLSGSAANDSHNHKWHEHNEISPSGNDTSFNSSGSSNALPSGQNKTSGIGVTAIAGATSALADQWTNNDTHGHTITVSHDGTDRLAAAIGTMQYPDLS
jgi:hypothetical protein